MTLRRGKPLRRTGFTPAQRATRLTRTVMKAKRAKVTPEERNARKVVAERSGQVCEVCGGRRATNMHHRRKAGRVWAPENLLHVCGSGTTGCHGHIEANPQAAQEQGWWVPSHKDPATTPAWLAGRGYCFLTPEGDVQETEEAA